MIVDLFAGPGGWDEGLRQLGVDDVLGVELEPTACATAEAAGHVRMLADIAETDPHSVAADVVGLIGSPPCPGFSTAGLGLGRRDLDLLTWAIGLIGKGSSVADTLWAVRAQQDDERSALTLEPLRWAVASDPEWVALEQVPAVLPLWEAYAAILRARGYSVWVGYLQAEQYGVPQTRKRAVLTASRTRTMTAPTPTHSRFYPRTPEKLDAGVAKWVSMGDALGSGADLMASPSGITGPVHRPISHPAATVTGAGNYYTYNPADPRETMRSLTAQQAGLLQTFPHDYPWQGNKGQRQQQVGNAVPPLLAAHIGRSLGLGTVELEVAA